MSVKDTRSKVPTKRSGGGQHLSVEQRQKLRENNRVYNASNLALVCRMLLAGNSKTDAFKRIGINVDTGFDWLRKGKTDENADPLLVKFARIAEKAVARFNARMVAQVTDAAMSSAPNTWQAAMTLLERRDPENWGKREKTTIEVEGNPLIQLNQIVLTDEETREVSRDLLRRVTAGRKVIEQE